MKKYPRPELFIPKQEDRERIAKEIAKNLSTDKVVMIGDKMIKGKMKK
ncbi:TPA: hypothetical protein JRX32_003541 [Elizabethkingia anophelis]|nr:hypothetical protein [Elizabethkingia anophelis]HAY3548994.1 hypothetical protein [Elizabethkingia anophelis]HAY3593782.1 hypothetical protein [Elizabethkingia anophelis]